MGIVTNRRRARGRNFLSRDAFFQKVSEYSNYLDIKTVELVYFGLVKAVVQELRREGIVRFPELGDFDLIMYAARKIKNPRTGAVESLPPRRTIKFRPNYKLNRYFRMLDELAGRSQDD